MPKPTNRTYSHNTLEALRLFGQTIRQVRIERNFTAEDLAARAGVSRMLLHRLERGEVGTSIGAAFEVATILGIALFDAEPERLSTQTSRVEKTLALLPMSARKKQILVKDDF